MRRASNPDHPAWDAFWIGIGLSTGLAVPILGSLLLLDFFTTQGWV